MKTAVHIAPRRIGHLNLFVSDLERSMAFYRDVCGFREVFREPGISMVFMSNGNTHHDLGLIEIGDGPRVGKEGHVQVRPDAGRKPGLNHVGFEMQSEYALVQAYERAREAGMAISRTTDHQIARSLYMKELNGFVFEFYADMIEDWSGFYSGHCGELISGQWIPDRQQSSATERFPRDPKIESHSPSVLTSRNVAFVCLSVASLMDSIRFYAEILGLEVTIVDFRSRIGLLEGRARAGCDVLLVEREEVHTRGGMLFGGIRLAHMPATGEIVESLASGGVRAQCIGTAEDACIAVRDPDGIGLVLSRFASREAIVHLTPDVLRALDALSNPATANS